MLSRKNIKGPTIETRAHIGWAGGSASDLGSLTEQRGRDKVETKDPSLETCRKGDTG